MCEPASAGTATMLSVTGAVVLRDGAGAVPEAFVEAFERARIASSTPLVQKILEDVEAYQRALDAERAAAGGAIIDARLRAAEAAVWSQQVPVSDDPGGGTRTIDQAWIDAAADDSIEGVAPTSLAHLPHARFNAGPVSIVLYEVASAIVVTATQGRGEVTPGGVKGNERIVFKALTKYGGDCSKVHDLSRATVEVDSLDDVAAVVEAVLASKDLVVIRCKNRFDPGYDALPSGGYRDFQMLCLIRDATGAWRYAELQVNLRRMVQIKQGLDEHGVAKPGGGGHGLFNQARLIDAFSARTLRYNGKLSDKVIDMVRTGVLLAMDVANTELTPELEAALLAAFRSPECRLRSLG